MYIYKFIIRIFLENFEGRLDFVGFLFEYLKIYIFIEINIIIW